MKFSLKLTTRAIKDMEALARDAGQQKRFKSVQKAFGLLETNPKHQSLRTHKFQSLQGPNGEPVFEAYAENKTPAAYRIFFYYGPNDEIVIIAITPHP
ncbi:MAG: type II toxin-antitoxin system RelE/ParE family toxin [Candidatus Binatus sp.]|uniref:type II toxin-antitoxin system RelE/ParE family toxin n=1 Tax=Candidatus Binatus sp. TaxID=2811406 RepID=UPI003C786918